MKLNCIMNEMFLFLAFQCCLCSSWWQLATHLELFFLKQDYIHARPQKHKIHLNMYKKTHTHQEKDLKIVQLILN